MFILVANRLKPEASEGESSSSQLLCRAAFNAAYSHTGGILANRTFTTKS